MIRLAGCLFLLPCLFGQNFDPKLPAPVPGVDGSLEESPKVRYIDVRKGDGPLAAAGQRYTLVYTGWLRDGKKFSSADDPQHPFQFVPGRRQVIAGFELGFDGMRVGGKRTFVAVCPGSTKMVAPQPANAARASGSLLRA